jgi:hypothetical protein
MSLRNAQRQRRHPCAGQRVQRWSKISPSKTRQKRGLPNAALCAPWRRAAELDPTGTNSNAYREPALAALAGVERANPVDGAGLRECLDCRATAVEAHLEMQRLHTVVEEHEVRRGAGAERVLALAEHTLDAAMQPGRNMHPE